MDESNATCGKRLESIGLENTVENRQAYRELLVTTPGLGQFISGGFRHLDAGLFCSLQHAAPGNVTSGQRAHACDCECCACDHLWPTLPSSGAILFEETLFQDTRKGTSMVDELNKNVSSLSSSAGRVQPVTKHAGPWQQLGQFRSPHSG